MSFSRFSRTPLIFCKVLLLDYPQMELGDVTFDQKKRLARLAKSEAQQECQFL